MKTFISYAEEIKALITHVVASDQLHAKWLNTLSFLENCGARKIAACEHPTLVKQEMLKHAAEEFRHAYNLKHQIEKISHSMPAYTKNFLLGGASTMLYLPLLDLKTSRYLKHLGYSKSAIREAAYLLVTYAIELRAAELYPIYEEVLRACGSKIFVKSIVLEEKEHLKEMEEGLKLLSSGQQHAEFVCSVESLLCQGWLKSILGHESG